MNPKMEGAPTRANEITFSRFENIHDNAPKLVSMDWPQLCERLKKRSVRTGKDGPLFSGAIYPEQVWRREDKPQGHKNEQGKPFRYNEVSNPTPEELRPPIRANEFVEAVSLAIFDFDFDATLDQIVKRTKRLNNGAGAAAVIYSTWSHTPETPKFRLVIWLATPVPASDWPDVWARLSRHFDNLCDASAKDAARIQYAPSCPKSREADAVYIELDGAPLDVATLPTIPKAAPTTPATPTNIGGSDAYARRTLKNECERLKETTSHRNKTLNDKAMNIGGYIGAGRLNRADAENALEAAMHANGYVEKDGLAAMRATMKSGLDAGARTPNYQNLPTERTRSKSATQPPTETQPETTEEARGPYALNEIGNGKRFADANRGLYLFDYTANRWRVYVNGVWRYTDGDDVERAAKITEAQICDEARAEADDDRRAKLYKHAATITKRKTRETMLKDAASELGMSAPPECFDAQLHLFNVQNGTLDLRTCQLMPHNATDLLTKCAGTKFDPHATAPTWTRALETWMPDAATRDYLQECAGLSLSGEVRDEFFNFLFGGGANGKTTFLSTLESVSGDYYRHAKAEIFMRSKFARDGEASTPGLLSLQGARLLTVSEIEGEHEMSAALVKGLTGRDPITARGNYDKRPTTFRPQFTLWMFGNEKPQIADASDGMWRRVRLIEFNQVIPKADRDPDFAEKLEAELSGVLNWALDGLKRVQQRGLIVPEAVSVSTASYRAEQDTMSGFLADMCELSPTAFVTRTELWEAWKAYCADRDEPEETQKTFNQKLRKQGPKDTRQYIGGVQTQVWKGLRLK